MVAHPGANSSRTDAALRVGAVVQSRASLRPCPTGHIGLVRVTAQRDSPNLKVFNNQRECIMGKYVVAWFLGVPAVVLAVVYVIFR